MSVVAIGVLAGIWQYRKIVKVAPKKVSFVVTAARKDLYGDVMNETLLMRPGQSLTKALNIFDKSVIERIYELNTQEEYGARPLKRIIQNLCEDFLSEEILRGNIKENENITLKYKSEKLTIVKKLL